MRVVVTGASRGLGLGLCTVLAERGDAVFAACRKTTPALSALPVTVVEGIDVAEEAMIARLRAAVGAEPLDGVICNASINTSYVSRDVDTLDLRLVLDEYRTNTLGMARTVQALLPSLRAGSKIILLSTSGGTLGRNPLRGGSYGYRMSKAAINSFGFLLASELRPRGIAVRIVSPGPVDTDMTRDVSAAGVAIALKPGEMPDAVTAGRILIRNMDELTLDDTGSWVDQTGKHWA